MEQQTMETGGQGQEVRTYTAEQFKGLLADKQAEVKKRQEAEKRTAELEKQIAALQTQENKARTADDPHTLDEKPQNDDNRPLTMNDLAEMLGREADGMQNQPQAPQMGGRVAGGVPGSGGMTWFNRRRNVPVSQMSDRELNELAQEVD